MCTHKIYLKAGTKGNNKTFTSVNHFQYRQKQPSRGVLRKRCSESMQQENIHDGV